jgi:hypothetical protein
MEPRYVRLDNGDPDDEPFIAVAPTPIQCFLALGDLSSYERLSIYETETLDFEEASWVFDYSLTKEKRLRTPHRFKRIGIIEVNSLYDIGMPDIDTCGISDDKIIKNLTIIKQWLIDNAGATFIV